MKRDKYGNIASGIPTHQAKWNSTARSLSSSASPKVARAARHFGGAVGVSPMAAPKSSIFQLRSKASSMIKNSRRTSHRDRLAGRYNVRYSNPLLTQDRVSQVFGYNPFSGGYYDDDCYDVEADSGEYQLQEEDFVPENYQYELPLTNVETLEGDHRKMITRYERALEIMGAQALLWEDLMADLRENPHLEQEFNKFQMLRKLSGGRL